MSKRPIGEDDLHALADGRLEEERRLEVEAWLRDHPREAATVQSWRNQKSRLHDAYDTLLDEAIPARLLDVKPRRRRFPALSIAASFTTLALGIVIGFVMRGEARMAAPSLASLPRQAAIAHVVYTPEVRHPVEVGADQEAHLVAWLSKRLGTPLKPPHLDGAGYALVGGRLLPGDTGAVAQFMYQNERGQRLTLYVRNDPSSSQETAFRYAREPGAGVFYWVDGHFGYALSGDLNKDTLLKVATLAYRQLNP